MGFSSWQGATETSQNNDTQPFSKCAHLQRTRPILAKQGRRPNAKHNPSRSKSPLKVRDYKVGGALTRREQSFEPERITSDN
jgi:hypothetical protein